MNIACLPRGALSYLGVQHRTDSGACGITQSMGESRITVTEASKAGYATEVQWLSRCAQHTIHDKANWLY